MPAESAAGPPAEFGADLVHEGAGAGSDFDDVLEAGVEGGFQPVGDALAEEGGEGGAGAEVTVAPDGLDFPAVVADLGVEESPLHEAVEGLSLHRRR